MALPDQSRRRYDSPVRRRRVAETRERIVTAGAELLHGFPIWNWDALTPRAVAEQAGVTERTVYRYFAGERELRDAVMERMEHDGGRRTRRPDARAGAGRRRADLRLRLEVPDRAADAPRPDGGRDERTATSGAARRRGSSDERLAAA